MRTPTHPHTKSDIVGSIKFAFPVRDVGGFRSIALRS